MTTAFLVSASWLLTMRGSPRPGGALVVEGDRIVAVGSEAELRRRFGAVRRLEFPGHALLPALVNAHTHLELTGLGGPPGGESFPGWLLEVVNRKRAAEGSDWSLRRQLGAQACAETGQGLVADILSVAGSRSATAPGLPGVLCFPELLGATVTSFRTAARRWQGQLGQHGKWAGVSPHSPYTVCAEGYRWCARHVAHGGGLLMTHAAESGDEVEFLTTGGGAIAGTLYARLGVAPPRCPGEHPLTWLDRLRVLGGSTVLVHLVQANEPLLDLVARRRCRVVLCPRSNRNLGVGTAPGKALLERGVALALGTDSELSGGDLDLWQDVVAAVEDYGLSPREALEMATVGGANVLGHDGEAGALSEGFRADLVAVPLAGGVGTCWEEVLASAQPAAVWLRGQRVV